MMYPETFNGLAIGFHLHAIFGILALLGGILLIFWAVKHLNKKRLLHLTIWLLLIGILGTLLTAGLGIRGWRLSMDGEFHNEMFKKMNEVPVEEVVE